jgi:hypothetical protein
MTDKHVDDLLGDLDRALGVEVSPSVAARVRTNRAATARRRGLGWFAAAAAIAGMFVVGVGYFARPRPIVGPQMVATSLPPRASEPTALGPRASALARTESRTPRTETRMPNPEPRGSSAESRVPSPESAVDDRPLVAANTRLALRQVAATLRGSGAIERAAVEIPSEPLTLVLSTFVPDTFAVEAASSIDPANAGAASTQ